MKLLLDEMWAPTIAHDLRRRGFDVIAINEPEHAPRYAGLPDDAVFARAQDDARTIVTDNISDFEMTRRDWESRGHTHNGVIYAQPALQWPSRRYGRTRNGARTRAFPPIAGSEA